MTNKSYDNNIDRKYFMRIPLTNQINNNAHFKDYETNNRFKNPGKCEPHKKHRKRRKKNVVEKYLVQLMVAYL